MLINELHRSPAGIIESTLKLLRFALDLVSIYYSFQHKNPNAKNVQDTGSVYSSTVDIVLYVMRVASRMNNYMCFMIDHALGRHDCISAPLRDVVVTPTVLGILQKGQQELQNLLFGAVHKTLEDWCYQAMKACENKGDEEVYI